MDFMLPKAFLHLLGQALVSASTVVSFGIYAIKMAVPNKICSDSKAVKIHVAKLGTWQMLWGGGGLMTARLSDYSIIKHLFFSCVVILYCSFS